MKQYFVCERCNKRYERVDPINNVRGFEYLCTFCLTDNELLTWIKRRGDQMIQQGKVKDRWEVIQGIHVEPSGRGMWNLYREREDDLYFEKFHGNKKELRARCRELDA